MKIAIIGAGISGLYSAWKLAEAGHNVTVFEKRKEIGKRACSGLFSDRLLDFIPKAVGLVKNEISSVLIHFPKKTIEVHFSKRFLVMNHFELDRMVAQKAEAAGAKIRLGWEVSSLFLEYDKIIGCDGPNSIVRRKLNLSDPSFRLGITGFIKKEDSRDFVETWPIKNGFIWRIPRGKETEYGILGNTSEVKDIFDRFLKERSLFLERIESALVPQGLILSNRENVALLGDASGLCKPWSGGGVVWGLIASSLLLKYFPDLIKYKNSLKGFFLIRIFISKVATWGVYFLGFKLPWLLPKKVKIESDFLF